ncbi:MAG: MgtC/SapB family protein [Gammaproteobacteria bacterium]|nr:MgtC/SapB family protein [Gammaproteobacteria bacterium]
MLAYQDVLLRLLIAAVLGGAVGLERERLEWAAGLRTHMLVCVGAALLMLVSAFGFADILGTPNVVLDPSRIAAQVVSGIGFLGAGTILFLRHEIIRGLTTAASLWTVAAVGLAVGSGMYVAALATTAIVVIILAVMKPLERRLFHRDRVRQMIVAAELGRTSLVDITTMLEATGMTVTDILVRRGEAPGADQLQFTFARSVERKVVLAAIDRLKAVDGVRSIACRP